MSSPFVQDSTLVGRWVLELNSGRIFLSDQIYQILGLKKNNGNINFTDVINKFHNSDDRDKLKAFIDQVQTSENQNSLEIEYLRPDNESRVLFINIEPPKKKRHSSHRVAGYIQDITHFKLHEQKLLQSENKWRSLTQNTPDIIMHIDLEGRILFINYALPEHTPEMVIQLTLYDFLPRDQQVDIDRCLNSVKQTGKPDKFDVDYPDPTGNIRHFEGYVSALKEDNVVVSLIVAARDITDRRKAENQMLKLSRALANTADTVLITDLQGNIEYVNNSFENLTGYSASDLLEKNISTLTTNNGDNFYKYFLRNMKDVDVYTGICVETGISNKKHHVQKTISALKNNAGEVTNFVSIGKDVTQFMLTQEKLQYLATHDALTKLPNRSLYFDRLEQALTRAHWHDRLVAVLFVDIDRFKYVNDTLGHEIGDRLLQKITHRLQKSVRDGDTVARLGGDEFAILLDDVANEEDISKLAQKIVDSLKPKFNIDEYNLHVTASIGVSLHPNDSDQAGELLKNADMAMYRAKELGKDNFQYYSDDLSSRAFQRLNLEVSLRAAIVKNELEIYYQPQYDYKNKKLVAMEALLRWNHPELGVILPSEFIHLLEETSLIIEVGNWVLRKACHQVKQWHSIGYKELVISVNFSSRQFSDFNLVESIGDVLDQEDLEAKFLEIEITESLIINNVKNVVDSINKLSRMGIKFALDDFGTGYSSLSYLKRFPIHTLKIDRSFIHDITNNDNDIQITKAIIAMSKMLNLQVVAEGVETSEQLAILQENDCNIVQGYYCKEPAPANECSRFLEEMDA